MLALRPADGRTSYKTEEHLHLHFSLPKQSQHSCLQQTTIYAVPEDLDLEGRKAILISLQGHASRCSHIKQGELSGTAHGHHTRFGQTLDVQPVHRRGQQHRAQQLSSVHVDLEAWVPAAAASKHEVLRCPRPKLGSVQQARLPLGLVEGQVGEEAGGAQVPQLQRVGVPPGACEDGVSLDIQGVTTHVGPVYRPHAAPHPQVPDQHRVVPAARHQHIWVIWLPGQAKYTVAVAGGVDAITMVQCGS
mmetsp:Transcript_13998/g.30278  ORF Transcript_13998/g.30278 Transcript_13998/m.30278 type:complete len:247 (-) Transcript_13998:740-1480(-)